jgi:hypothetical protein
VPYNQLDAAVLTVSVSLNHLLEVSGELDGEDKRTLAGRYTSIMRSSKKLSSFGGESPVITIETATDKCVVIKGYESQIVVVQSKGADVQ